MWSVDNLGYSGVSAVLGHGVDAGEIFEGRGSLVIFLAILVQESLAGQESLAKPSVLSGLDGLNANPATSMTTCRI